MYCFMLAGNNVGNDRGFLYRITKLYNEKKNELGLKSNQEYEIINNIS